METFQCNASLTITGAARGTSQERLYQKLGLESLKIGRWLRPMCYFYKLITTQMPLYLFNQIPPKLNSLQHSNTNSVIELQKRLF